MVGAKIQTPTPPVVAGKPLDTVVVNRTLSIQVANDATEHNNPGPHCLGTILSLLITETTYLTHKMPVPLQATSSPPDPFRHHIEPGPSSSSGTSHTPYRDSPDRAAPFPGSVHAAQRPSLGSSAAAAAAAANAHAESSGARLSPEEIEMAPIAPAGHRRRRSSPSVAPAVDATAPSRLTNPRMQSVRNTGSSAQDEPKIIEEDSDTDGLRTDERDDDSLSDEDLHDDEETGLTRKDRQRKRRKRRHNTRLDQRIVRDRISAEEKKEADQNVVRKLLVNALLIGLWYLFSLSISLVSVTATSAWRIRRKTVSIAEASLLTPRRSTTSGCSEANDSISPSRYSPQPCICWCSFHWPLWFYISSLAPSAVCVQVRSRPVEARV